MSKVTIEIPPGYELVQTGEGKWEQRKIEKKLPKTWKEFCETYPVQKGECFIGTFSNIIEAGRARTGREDSDKHMLPNKETAEAILALMQLIQLRNFYNGDWEPDWTDYGTNKYVIINRGNTVKIVPNVGTSHALSFESKELATEFLNNFGDLIEIAKPLI